MRFDWSSLFLFTAIFNILLTLSFALISGKFQNNRKSVFWFVVLELSIVIILFESIIRNSALIERFHYFLFVSTPVLFIIQPALLLYQNALRGKRLRIWPYFIVPVLSVVMMLPTFMMNADDKLAMFNDESSRDPVWIIAFYFVYFGLFQFLIFRTHARYQKELASEYSKNTLEWQRLTSFAVAISGFALFTIPLLLVAQYFSLPEETINGIRKNALVGFSTISHVLMFSVFLSSEEKKISKDNGKRAMENEDFEDQKVKLLNFVKTQKPYLDNDLTLNNLAHQLDCSRSLLSAVINRGLGQNFYDFINALRLEELDQKIKDQEHKTYSLDHLVQQCGFTNYVSFYRFVKRTRNTSPSAYIKQLEVSK